MEEEIAEKNKLPKWIAENLVDWKLSIGTSILAVDISIYFAEVLLSSYPKLKWGFPTKPKSRAYLHQPVVLGFKNGEMEPTTIIINLSRSEINKEPNNGLIGFFNVWSTFV